MIHIATPGELQQTYDELVDREMQRRFGGAYRLGVDAAKMVKEIMERAAAADLIGGRGGRRRWMP